MNFLRDRGKVEAIAAVLGIDLPMVGVGFLPALFGAGVGGLAISLEILLQTCVPLGAEAPGKSLRIAKARENVGAKDEQEQQSAERGGRHNESECISGNKVNATLLVHWWYI
jgi:hypothetical protein